MARYAYFTLEELVKSDTAIAHGLTNCPSWEAVDALDELVRTILEPLRAAYGQPLRVTSGYRCSGLNTLVGGTVTSAHLGGWAADIVPVDGDVDKLITFAEEWLQRNGIPWDQSINESSNGGAHWWHIGVRNLNGEQRRQTFAMVKATQ